MPGERAAATIRELCSRCESLLVEGRQVKAIAEQSAGFAASLREAVDAAVTADRDLRSIEASHGIVLPSRRSAPDLSELDALWARLA